MNVREFDYNGQVLSKIQAELFSEYYIYEKCSPLVFIRRFMNSDLAERFDNLFILTEASSIYTFVEELDEQYGPTTFGNPYLYNFEALYWVGYLLRYWCYTYEINSKQLIQKINLKKIIERYYIYHSMDPALSVQTIMEEDNIVIDNEVDVIKIIEELKKKYH